MEHRLGAIGGILLHGEIGDHKTGAWKKPKFYSGETDRPAKRTGHRPNDAGFVPIDAEQRWEDNDRN